MDIPRVLRIRQEIKAPQMANFEQSLQAQIRALALEGRVKPGQTVAIGCTSRGIPEYAKITRLLVAELRRLGLEVFLFPAMGSHGAATPAGQAAFLRGYGLTEEYVGAPIRSQVDVVEIAKTADLGIPVYVDKLAMAADYMVVLNRIKTHTDFINDFESGVIKILAIGLGKFYGTTLYHKAILSYGFPRVLADVATKVLETNRVLFGLGVVENSRGQIADAQVLPTDNFANLRRAEAKMLDFYKSIAPKLPFDYADVLVVDQAGKDVSGTGIDTKVVGRILKPLISPEPASPKIKRLVALGLTEHAAGSPGATGMLDFGSRNLEQAADWQAVTVNGVAASMPEFCKKPAIMPTDCATVEAACNSVGLVEPAAVALMRIRHTNYLEELYVSEHYLPQLAERADLTIISPSAEMQFDEQGTVIPL